MEQFKQIEEEYRNIVDNKLVENIKIVFGEGNKNADIMLIGEAPGEKEEEMGRPFVGQAGKNLDEFLNLLSLKRDEIYITNVVKIRPYKINEKTGRKSNRPPNSKEIEMSVETLRKEIEIICPNIIVTLGNIPLRAILMDKKATIGEYHGKAIMLDKFVLFPLYHPASIIYNRELKHIYYDDILKLKDYIKGREENNIER
ncbi:DNA polymerase [Caloramator quimbayensis]|uniref:Type-4 uracil-DNA glycosylase n=1 Tax=Caloramator quimbayensis TaxID=1147123 RepID=A0A1T4YHF7_9CLOT|nr:uracil-DNA glycosylase [Caloramator quimbayensis]SKB00721.1 DNA polymerase [Caloramator quimbayensis]